MKTYRSIVLGVILAVQALAPASLAFADAPLHRWNPPPVPVSFAASTPYGVPNDWTTFTTIVADGRGAMDIREVRLTLALPAGGLEQMKLFYFPRTGRLQIERPGGPRRVGCFVGQAKQLITYWYNLDCGGTQVFVNDDLLTIAWRVKFKRPLAGTYGWYIATVFARDANHLVGPQEMGAWEFRNE